MHLIHARNVNDAYSQTIKIFQPMVQCMQPDITRYGNAWALDGPVVTEYSHPLERVLWDSHRECHPFFHLFESLWMLAGREDVEYLTQFVKRMATFSDDGVTVRGAYGYRWRNWFKNDQIVTAVRMLREDPTSCRAFISMWDVAADLGVQSKDIPCNIGIKLEIRFGHLDMTVFNRSNDMIWGAYGANAVHMAFLQEFVANALGIPVGRYWQISANFHTYEASWNEKVRPNAYVDQDLYRPDDAPLFIPPTPMPLFIPPTPMPLFQKDERCGTDEMLGYIGMFCMDSSVRSTKFLRDVAGPLKDVWDTRRTNPAKAMMMIHALPNQGNDWVMACRRWMEARASK